jgi:hypothetical protein
MNFASGSDGKIVVTLRLDTVLRFEKFYTAEYYIDEKCTPFLFIYLAFTKIYESAPVNFIHF